MEEILNEFSNEFSNESSNESSNEFSNKSSEEIENEESYCYNIIRNPNNYFDNEFTLLEEDYEDFKKRIEKEKKKKKK